jgi:hypothetical protein
MVENIGIKKPMEIQYLSPNFPRFLWRFMAVRNWKKIAKNNGLNKKAMLKRL